LKIYAQTFKQKSLYRLIGDLTGVVKHIFGSLFPLFAGDLTTQFHFKGMDPNGFGVNQVAFSVYGEDVHRLNAHFNCGGK
jgi:hypothetical protein